MAAYFSQGEQSKSKKVSPNGSQSFCDGILELIFFTSTKFYLLEKLIGVVHINGEETYTVVWPPGGKDP